MPGGQTRRPAPAGKPLLQPNGSVSAMNAPPAARAGAPGEPYQSATQLEYVDKLDAADGAPEAADVEWLVRTASLGPEVISDATVAELVELASDLQVPWGTREAAQAVLVPLTTAGRVLATAAAPVALANLAEGPGPQAGRLLVAAANAVPPADSVTRQGRPLRRGACRTDE